MVVKLKIISLGMIMLLSIATTSFPQKDSCYMISNDEACDLQINGTIYHIEANGVLSVKSSGKSSEVKVGLPECCFIDSVKYQIYENKILFTFGITDADNGSAIIAKFDPTNYRLLWSTEMYAFNISPLLISEKYIYVAGIGMVAKIKLSNGKKIWQHRDLYGGSGAYNIFLLPKKEGNTIIFKDDSSIREVRVDDATGKIISK